MRVRFGDFELDLQAGQLRKRGLRIKLQDQPFLVLAALLEKPGEVVTREELQQQIWPDGTYVDFDQSLNKAVNKLRDALADSADRPRYIETLPRRGYRFIGALERSDPSSAEARQPDSSLGSTPRSHHAFRTQATRSSTKPEISQARTHARRAWLIGAVAVVVASAGVARWAGWSGVPNKRSVGTMSVTPITSYPGRETTPSFSPDGSQIAFAWEGEKGDNFDIYVQVVGESKALRLTTDPRPEFGPAWSPDGRHIAFCRDSEDGSEIVLIPALGGPERILAYLARHARSEIPERPIAWFPTGSNPDQFLTWFPDGEFLAVVARRSERRPHAIFRLSVNRGEMQPVTSPSERSWGDDSPSVSPDGRRLAFIRHVGEYAGEGHLYVVPTLDRKVPTAELQQLTSQDIGFDGGLAWTSDSRRLVFSSDRGLWTVGLTGAAPELLALTGYRPTYPAIPRRGNRLAFVHSSSDLDIWRTSGPALVANKPAGVTSSPTRLISSTQLDTNPQYSPDKSRIAFTSTRTGTLQIWVCDSDGSNTARLTDLGPVEAATPRWSPDGRYISFDADASDIYVVPAQGGPVRRITPESSLEDMSSWSRDGQWIYFESDRSGDFQIWKAPFAGGPAIRVTDKGGAEAFESYDGKFVYYTKWGWEGIWRKPVEGGAENLVVDRGSPYHWGLFEGGLCVLEPRATAAPTLDCLDFGTNRMSTVSVLPKNTRINEGGPSFSISRDGRWVLFVGVERQESDIMLVDHPFR